MARPFRAQLSFLAVGVALLTFPVAALAANGGAAPTSISPAVAGYSGGASPDAPAPTPAAKPKPVAKPKPAAKPRTAPAARARSAVAGVFPLLGHAWSMDGADLRFGAKRNGHVHEGQDILAPEGTPIVAPLAGSVTWSANQPGGAGIYVVIHGSDGRDYVFMHIRPKTLLVAPDDTVAAGQRIAEVGHTGDAQGPHLHFEIWVGGWYEKGGAPIDPLPDLQHWAGLS